MPETTLSGWDSGDFAISTAVSGNVIFVGAGPLSRSSVYVFRYQNGAWKPEQLLTPPNSQDSFATSLYLEGASAVIGGGLGYDFDTHLYRFDGFFWRLEKTVNDQPAFGLSRSRALIGSDVYLRSPSGVWEVEQSLEPLTHPEIVLGALSGNEVWMVDAFFAGPNSPTGRVRGRIHTLQFAGDCDQDGVPDICQIIAGELGDCDRNLIADECDLSCLDCNDNGVPDDFEPDCNGNGIPDDCELDSPDCDGDGVIDACQIGRFGTPARIDFAGPQSYYYLSFGMDHNVVAARSAESADVYRRNGADWVFEQTLQPTLPGLTDHFGLSAAASGDTLAMTVETAGQTASQVRIYRYEGGNWNESAILPDEPTAARILPLRIHGSRIFMGIPLDSTDLDLAGSVLVFQFNGHSWIQEARLTGEPRSGERFGFAIDADGNQLYVVARGDVGVPSRVYVFEHDGASWTRIRDFGLQVPFQALNVSANQRVAVAHQSGVEVYSPDGEWEASIETQDSSSLVQLVQPRLITPDRLVVGAPRDQLPGAPRTGLIYHYEREGQEWILKQMFVPPDVANENDFGQHVAVRGNRMAVSSASNPGKPITVWMYELGADCNDDGVLDSCAIAAGSPDLNLDGIPDECQCLGDLNGDSVVDYVDLTQLLASFGTSGPGSPGDVNGNGNSGLDDLVIMLMNFGRVCD